MPEPGRSLSRRRALRIGGAAGLLLAMGGGLTAAVLRRAGLHGASETRTRMGTLVQVRVVHPEAARARELAAAAFDEIDRLEAVFSGYRPDTAVSRLNRDGVLSDPPPELVAVVRRALHFAELTGGAFDPTVAPLMELYRSSFAENDAPPAENDVMHARSLVGYRRVRLDAAGIAFARPGMSVSLDGIAKGYILDRVVAQVTAAGAAGVLADGGGDVSAGEGEVAGTGWPVGVEHPREPGTMLGTIEVRHQGVATSGDYMRAYTDDLRHHHIVDPRTGASPGHTSAATVVAPSAMDADALATAAMVLGPVHGIELLERVDGAEGVIVTRELDLVRSSGFGA
ncbi:MAG: FAD:protein FMN transferase [Gammaproteobacteria bacterium]|nr:FAD:protein FMN transferase [Gammaproteobacteria bacterium]